MRTCNGSFKWACSASSLLLSSSSFFLSFIEPLPIIANLDCVDFCNSFNILPWGPNRLPTKLYPGYLSTGILTFSFSMTTSSSGILSLSLFSLEVRKDCFVHKDHFVHIVYLSNNPCLLFLFWFSITDVFLNISDYV